ncbi:hypothetical protein Drorol1_Dr00024816 [Drosera rotundifolia]
MNVIELKEAGGGVSKNDLVISEVAGVENTRGNGSPLYYPFSLGLIVLNSLNFHSSLPKRIHLLCRFLSGYEWTGHNLQYQKYVYAFCMVLVSRKVSLFST